MIKIDYFGRSGNNWFQYVYALILSKRYNRQIISPTPDTFLTFMDFCAGLLFHKNDDNKDEKAFKITDDNCERFIEGDCSEMLEEYDIIHLHGYFQKASLYNKYRDAIKSFIFLQDLTVKDYDDIVIHLRLTDYWWIKNLSVISPCWYLGLLRKEKYRKCYIVVEPHKTNYHYLKYFSHLKNIEIVSGTPAEDFEFIRGFDRIICSNSTFCWWAAFLSDASKIYTFKPWMNNKGIELANMAGATVVDGSFIRNRNLENLDWNEYWKK